MRRGSIFWGIVLVLLGLLLLGQTTGFIPRGINVWAIFWSLLLVAGGIMILMRATGRDRFLRGGLERESVSRELNGAQRGSISIQHGAGELRVDASAAGDVLFSGTFGGGVNVTERRQGSELSIDLSAPSDVLPVVPFGGGELNWSVSLNPAVPLSLHLELGASRNLLNLRDLQLQELRLETGASATEMVFPARAGLTRARVRSGAASVDMRVPEGVAARIHAAGGLASINVDRVRFAHIGEGEYRSADYDTAANRLDLDVETGVGSVSVR
jgi:hypothetical protein